MTLVMLARGLVMTISALRRADAAIAGDSLGG
jgi:hypothetical protein